MVWIEQSQHCGRNGRRNISFEDKTLFSYSTPIAFLIKNDVVLITLISYLNTTSSHKRSVDYEAKRKEKKVFNVPRCVISDESQHQENVHYFIEEIRDSFHRFQRSISNFHHHFNNNSRLVQQLEGYCQEFGISVPVIDKFILSKEKVVHFLTYKIKQNCERFWVTKTEQEKYFNRVGILEWCMECVLRKEDDFKVSPKWGIDNSITKNPEALKIVEDIRLANRTARKILRR